MALVIVNKRKEAATEQWNLLWEANARRGVGQADAPTRMKNHWRRSKMGISESLIWRTEILRMMAMFHVFSWDDNPPHFLCPLFFTVPLASITVLKIHLWNCHSLRNTEAKERLLCATGGSLTRLECEGCWKQVPNCGNLRSRWSMPPNVGTNDQWAFSVNGGQSSEGTEFSLGVSAAR